MDKILQGIFDSNHPDGLKQVLIEQTLLQVKKCSMEDCRNILHMTTETIATNETVFIQTMCQSIFKVWASNNKECVEEFFTPVLLRNLLLSDGYPNKIGVLNLLMETFKILQGTPRSIELFEQMRLRANVFVNRVNSLTELRLICHLMILYPECIPQKETLRTSLANTIVQNIATVSTQVEQSKASSLVFDVNVISSIFKELLSGLDKQNVLNILRTIYVLVSSPNFDPSPALAAIVQYFPLSLSPQVVTAVMTDTSVSDNILGNSVQRMMRWLAWPADVSAIGNWILALLHGLALASKYSVLIKVTQNKIDYVVSLLDYVQARRGAMAILCHMLYSYQHSSDVFHKIIKDIPGKITILSSGEDQDLLNQFVQVIHTMIHLHTGFPDLYDPILAVLEKYPKPTVQTMNALLQENKWSAGHTTYATLQSSCMPRSDTGKTGLINMGNTCYINSVIQTLYMTDEFRNAILQASPTPQQSILSKIQYLFAFLTHTQRAAISACEFYEASRPPWFESGHQQDCSEYMRHLLDVLHEQELSAQANGNKKANFTKQAPLSPILRRVNPVLRSRATKRKNSGLESNHSDANSWSEPVENGIDPTPPSIKSLVQYTFAGKLVTSYKCFQCNQISESAENFIDLHLAFPSHTRHNRTTRYQMRQASKHANCINYTNEDGGTTNAESNGTKENGSSSLCLDDLVDYYLCPELLEGENKYFCSNCNGLSDAERSIRIVETPRYLILTLLRFSYDPGTCSRSKILTEVQYPLVLQLPVSETNDGGEAVPPNKQRNGDTGKDVVKCDQFLLYAVVVHSGVSSESGHYYACARHSARVNSTGNSMEPGVVSEEDLDKQQWCMFNDSHVTFCNFNSFGSVTKRFPKDTAYILLYKKCNMETGETNQTEMDPKKVPLEKEIREAIEQDNIHFLQEKEMEAKLSRQCRGVSKPSFYWRDFDDSNPPGSCGSGGGGGFNSLVSGNIARFVF